MFNTRRARRLVALTTVALLAPLMIGGSAGATQIRTSGQGIGLDFGWTEYDPDNILGLPGNVHVGFLYAESGPYGTYVNGNVTDFECEEGESPFGGHGGALAAIVDDGRDIVDDATQDALQAVVDSGGDYIDADAVLAAIRTDIAEDVPDVIEDEGEGEGSGFQPCDVVQERFLDGTETATLFVDSKKRIARLTGNLRVSNGGHGEPGDVIAEPPVDIAISRGQWNMYESAYSSRGNGYRYSYSDRGIQLYDATVTGRIGAMGFADDADDESYGGYRSYTFTSVERVR